MIEVQFIIPPDTVAELSKLFPMRHKHGFNGYFADLTIDEFWNTIRWLFNRNFRVDIKPGNTARVIARREG